MVWAAAEEDVWLFEASRARANRLKGLAVDNKHAGIRGLPFLNSEQAEYVTEAIIELKGMNGKKQKEAHKEGKLKALPKPLTYKGAPRWLTRQKIIEDWVTFGADGQEAWAQPFSTRPLSSIRCPTCMTSNAAGSMKLQGANGCFSNVKCKYCVEVTSSKRWACDCGNLWFKCSLHLHEQGQAVERGRRKRPLRVDEYGVDKPLPKFRKCGIECRFFSGAS